MPRPTGGESQESFVSRYMGSPEARRKYPDDSQRAAIAYSLWRRRKKKSMMVRKELSPYCRKSAGGIMLLDGPSEAPVTCNESLMSAEGIFCSSNRDRQGDVLLPEGIITTQHQENPVILLDHAQQYPIPIGVARDPSGNYTVSCDPDLGIAKQTTYFSQKLPVAEQVFQLICEGILKANSIGFRPIEFQRLTPDYSQGPTSSNKFIKSCELVEVSWVGVPANADCLTTYIESGRIGGKKMDYCIKSLLEPYRIPLKAMSQGVDLSTKAEAMSATNETTGGALVPPPGIGNTNELKRNSKLRNKRKGMLSRKGAAGAGLGALGGGTAGALVGGVVGSAVPVIGTGLGASIGSAIGAGAGAHTGGKIGEEKGVVGRARGAAVGGAIGAHVGGNIGDKIGDLIGNVAPKQHARNGSNHLAITKEKGIAGAAAGGIAGTVAGSAVGAPVSGGVLGAGVGSAAQDASKIGKRRKGLLARKGIAGGIAGGTTGALLGSVVPGVGTLAGSAIGGGLGSVAEEAVTGGKKKSAKGYAGGVAGAVGGGVAGGLAAGPPGAVLGAAGGSALGSMAENRIVYGGRGVGKKPKTKHLDQVERAMPTEIKANTADEAPSGDEIYDEPKGPMEMEPSDEAPTGELHSANLLRNMHADLHTMHDAYAGENSVCEHPEIKACVDEILDGFRAVIDRVEEVFEKNHPDAEPLDYEGEDMEETEGEMPDEEQPDMETKTMGVGQDDEQHIPVKIGHNIPERSGGKDSHRLGQGIDDEEGIPVHIGHNIPEHTVHDNYRLGVGQNDEEGIPVHIANTRSKSLGIFETKRYGDMHKQELQAIHDFIATMQGDENHRNTVAYKMTAKGCMASLKDMIGGNHAGLGGAQTGTTAGLNAQGEPNIGRKGAKKKKRKMLAEVSTKDGINGGSPTLGLGGAQTGTTAGFAPAGEPNVGKSFDTSQEAPDLTPEEIEALARSERSLARRLELSDKYLVNAS